MNLRDIIKTVKTRTQRGNSLTVCGFSSGQTLCSKANSASDYSELASNHPQSVHKQSGRKLVGTGDLVVTSLWPREFQGGGHESVAMIVAQKRHGSANEIWSRVAKEGTEERDGAKARKLCQWKKWKQSKGEDQYVLIYLSCSWRHLEFSGEAADALPHLGRTATDSNTSASFVWFLSG